MQVMGTSGGAHPPSFWAAVTANQILDLIVINPNPGSEAGLLAAAAAVQAKQALQPQVLAALAPHHTKIQTVERAVLTGKQAGERLAAGYRVPDEHMTDAARPVLSLLTDAVTVGPDIAAHFAQPDVIKTVRRIIGQSFANVMHIERSWHADRYPDSPEGQAFRSKFHGAPAATPEA